MWSTRPATEVADFSVIGRRHAGEVDHEFDLPGIIAVRKHAYVAAA